MEASEERVNNCNLEDDNFIEIENIVENIIHRLRICIRVICCLPFDQIIPSEIFQRNSNNVCGVKQELSQTRTAREIRFEMLPKSRTEKSKNENSVHKLDSKSQIKLKEKPSKDSEKNVKLPKCRSILKDKSKCENEELKPDVLTDLTEKKLQFESSEKKLQGKKARCRLFRSQSKKLKKIGTEMNGLVSPMRRKKKSSTSVKSSENEAKKQPIVYPKKGKKLKKKEKCVLLKFVCSDSVHALWQGPGDLTSQAEESGGDAPAKHYGIPPRVLNCNKHK